MAELGELVVAEANRLAREDHGLEAEAPTEGAELAPALGVDGRDVVTGGARGEGLTARDGLLATPGATRFYRSDGPATEQCVSLVLDEGARLEWLPLEAIAYPGCLARNTLRATLAEGAEMIGWDVCALGLPTAGQPFDRGSLTQHLEIPGLWLERSHIDATDARLLESPLGLGGHKCMGTLWLATGTPLTRERREQLLEAVRALLGNGRGVQVGATCPNPRMLVVRAVTPLVEPLMALFQQVWATLRTQAWGLNNTPPRIWSV